MASEVSVVKSFGRFWKLLHPERKEVYYIYIFAIFSGLISLSLPLGIQAIIGLIAGGNVSASWVFMVAGVTVGVAFTGILDLMQISVTESIQRRVFVRTAFDFTYRITQLDMEKLTGQYPPELVNRFFDIVNIQKGLPKILMDFSSGLIQIFFGLILLSFYHNFFVFFSVLVIGIVWIIFRFTGRRGLESSLEESNYKYQVAHWLEELARAQDSFRISGSCPLPLTKTDGLVNNYIDARSWHFKILMTQITSMVGFKILVTAALLILGSLLVINNEINIGQFVASEIIVLLIIESAGKLIRNMDVIYDLLTGLDKLAVVTDLPLQKQEGIALPESSTSPVRKGMSVTLKEVGYDAEYDWNTPLQKINLEIKSGERVCIAGNKDSGKSDLLRIIASLYTHYHGTVSFDGWPTQNLHLGSLRKVIGNLSKAEDIFRGTVYENITLGYPEITPAQVKEVMDMVGLHDTLHKMPDGLDTMLLPGGYHMSKGMRTKILLARCLVTQPKLIVCDELLQTLSDEDRLSIIQLLTDRTKPWTLVTVSDDPQLAAACDRIVVMQDGGIVFEGNYDAIKSSPYYQQIFHIIDLKE